MSKYLDYIKKRTTAAAEDPNVETVEVCADIDGYKATREAWRAAEAEEQKARIRLAALKSNDQQTGRKKLNAAVPLEQAEAELAEAKKAAAKAKAAVRECFVQLHVRSMNPAEARATYMDTKGDVDAYNRASLRKTLVKVTTHDGSETIADLTADVIADMLEVVETGESNRVFAAINEASEAVDFPT